MFDDVEIIENIVLLYWFDHNLAPNKLSSFDWRWLLAHNKNNEAVRILNKVAKVNGVTLSNSAKEMLTTISEERSKADKVRPSSHLLKSQNYYTKFALQGNGQQFGNLCFYKHILT